VDRSKTTLVKHDYCKGIQGGVVKLKNKELKLHLFIDKSMIEVYINQLKCLTTRTYNSLEDSLGVELVGNKSTIISNIEIWSLDTCYKNI
jgi:sucrose-6-phosphate hydrolase SacC (GH32 family)